MNILSWLVCRKCILVFSCFVEPASYDSRKVTTNCSPEQTYHVANPIVVLLIRYFFLDDTDQIVDICTPVNALYHHGDFYS